MKDVAALCRRVVIIATGRIMYDGFLGGIIDRFSGHKVITLRCPDGQTPGDLGRYGEVLSIETPRVKLRVQRNVVPDVLGSILASYPVEDVSVEDPPLEEVDCRNVLPGGKREETAELEVGSGKEQR